MYDELTDHASMDRLNSEETDEEFDWFEATEMDDRTYFNLVNKNRKTIQPGE